MFQFLSDLIDLFRLSRYAQPLGKFGLEYLTNDGAKVIIGKLDDEPVVMEQRIKLARRTADASAYNFLARTQVVYVGQLWDLNPPLTGNTRINHYASGVSLWLNVLGSRRSAPAAVS